MSLNYIDTVSGESGVWFLDENSYDYYSYFNDYATGAFPGNSEWVLTLSGYTSNIEVSGSDKQLKISGGSGTATIDTNTDFQQGKEYWFPIYIYGASGVQTGSSIAFYVRINGGSFTSFTSIGINANGAAQCQTYILATYNENNLWDIYVGGSKILSDQSSVTSIGIQVTASGGPSAQLIIRNVRMGKVFRG